MDKVMGINYIKRMTDFILHDGTMLDHGQRYIFTMFTGEFVCTIDALFPMKEKVIIRWSNDIIASITTGEDVVGDTTWDLQWSSFEIGYTTGLIRPYDMGKPTRKLPPHNFT